MFETHKIDTFFSGDSNIFDKVEEDFTSRRTKVVRFFKLFLPCLTATLLGVGVALFSMDNSSSGISIAEEEKVYFEKFMMKNTVFELTEKDNKFSVLKALVVEEKNAGTKIYDLTSPDAKTIDGDKVITIKALAGVYNQNKEELFLSGDVQSNHNNEMLIKTNSITYNFKKEYAVGNDKIAGVGENKYFKADKFSMDKKKNILTLIGNVVIKGNNIDLATPQKATMFLNENKFVATKADIKRTTNKGSDRLNGDVLTVFFRDTKNFEITRAISNGNTKIISEDKTAFANKGEYFADKGKAYLYGNVKIKDSNGYDAVSKNGMYDFLSNEFHLLDDVKITQKRGDIFTKKAIYYTEKKTIKLFDDVKVKDNSGYIANAKSGEYDLAKESFVLDKDVKIVKDNNTAIANKAIYYKEKDELHLLGNVKISQEESTASANKGIYYIKKNVVELIDNVVITRDGNIVKGDKAISDFNTSKSKLIAKKGGRIFGKLIENKLK